MAIEQESSSDTGDTVFTAPLEEALAIAVSHHQAGDTELAETIYRSILQALPEHPDALQFLGLLLHGRGESREGAALLREAAGQAPANAGIWTNLGNVLLESGDADAAVEAYKRAVEVAPGYPAPHNNLGTVHRARNELAEAEAAYLMAIECDPHFGDAWHNLAVVMLATQRFHEAVQCALRSVVVSPEGGFPQKLADLANTRRRQMANAAAVFSAWLAEEPKDMADAAYRGEIERDAAYADSWHNLAVVMLATRHFDEAAQCGLRAVVLDHDHRHTLRLVGHAHAQRGQMEKAAEIFRRWLAEEPGSPLALHYLAACEGKAIPDRASDAYVESTFDSFAASFDEKLASLDYRAPGLVAEAVRAACGAEARELRILDAGCGTGLCGHEVRPMAAVLVGVDLSARMLTQASLTGAYDALEKSELTAYLAAHPGAFDVVLSADTLCYFGALESFADAAYAALGPHGVLVFSVEAMPEGETNDYRLQPNGRYVHNGDYVDRALAAAGLRVESRRSDSLRTEQLLPVAGWIVTARRPAVDGA